jgi:plastocyanin
MVRLVYLLIRQSLHRKRPAGADAAVLARWPALMAGVGVLALALGIAAHTLLGEQRTRIAPRDDPPPENATLRLHVAHVESVPLLVYLEAPGEGDSAIGDHRGQPAVQLTSVNGVFEPAFQVAPVAARVEVGNADPIPHNTHVFDGRRTLFNVAMPLQGVPVTKVLRRTGLFEVRCDLHSWMRAAVFVPPNPHHAVIREPGEFALRNVAPGTYRLHIWAPGRGKTTQVVDLLPGVTRTLELAAR